jgi:hypothetical protein
MVVANFGRHLHFRRRFVERNPVAALHLELSPIQRRIVPDHDAVARGVQFDDIKRLGRRKASPLRWPMVKNSIPVVLAQHLPAQIDNFAPRCFCASLAAERNLP